MKKQIVVSFTDDVYKCALTVVVGGDRNKFLKEHIGVSDEYIADNRNWPCAGMYYRILPKDNIHGNNCSVIWLKRASLLELVHELVHFCNCVLAQAGVTVTSRDDEALAYYLEFWLSRVRKKVRCR